MSLRRKDGLSLKMPIKLRECYSCLGKALFAYAVSISMENGYDGVLVFKAKTSELVEYYIRELGASHVGSYDPFRLVIWEDAAQELVDYFKRSN